VATGFEQEEKNNIDFKADEEAPKVRQVMKRPTLVVGGDAMHEDFLDVPTYMRQQRD